MNFQLRDAIYQPRISERILAASRQASRATTNDMLLETALAYNDLLEALQVEAVAKNTLANAKKTRRRHRRIRPRGRRTKLRRRPS